MIFIVAPYSEDTVVDDQVTAWLMPTDWDDHSFKTLFQLMVKEPGGERCTIGVVRIAYDGMESGETKEQLPERFEQLNESFFSLGRDDEYYSSLAQLSDSAREELLNGIHDLAFDDARLNVLIEKKERVLAKSLLRDTTLGLVRGQYRRIAQGGVRHIEFELKVKVEFENHAELGFHAAPASSPPTNVHALIGSNGVGKTFLLSRIAKGVCEQTDDVGIICQDATDAEFLNVVQVAFSPFDTQPRTERVKDVFSTNPEYTYIGICTEDLKRNKTSEELNADFTSYVQQCIDSDRVGRLIQTLGHLRSDPLLADSFDTTDSIAASALLVEQFGSLSSGHKIVLLTLAGLVSEVNERSLVLIDEPENHLHPPLLSSFIRAVSELFSDRNGIAIVGTHSPVVLQEIPSSCVWKLYRQGDATKAERPQRMVFGENVGILTREVFTLEVTNSGFYRMLKDAAEECETYDEVLRRFDGALGGEARALVRSLIANKE